ncbi:hypothetical protein [Mesorhizobium sp. M0040]|uniref:hypothetical protein n=1 Tax=Mesorhizobium sp. M0040 TaxID=2956855 RepID=UPI003335C8F5
MGFLDAYSIRARLFPAILAIAPAIALATVAVTWNTFSLPQAITTVSVAVIFVGFSDIARRFGKKAEREIFRTTGGRPTITLLRRGDPQFANETKDRYRNFLAKQLGEPAPTAEMELNNPRSVDGFYERCGNWLRERTRDTAKFKILFEENKTYGFRRNLYGAKWPALALNALVVGVCLLIISRKMNVPNDPSLLQVFTVLVIAAIHAGFFFFFVGKKTALEASDQYGRQLILSCETLMAEAK